MMSLTAYMSFLVAALIVIASPGPDSLNSLAIGLSRGRREGMAYALGVGVGCLVHTLWAVLGVAAVVAASATAFAVIKWLGVGYLLWLGVQSLRHAGRSLQGGVSASAAPASDGDARRRFGQGVLTNALNPKVMLFFLAFLPQFVEPARGSVAWQMALMGLSFTLITAVAYCAVAAGAGSLGRVLQRRPAIGAWLDRATGFVFVAMALRLALADRK